MSTLPEEGLINVARIFNVVLFPAPFGPRTPRVLFSEIVKKHL